MRTGCIRNAEEKGSKQAKIVILCDPVINKKLLKIKKQEKHDKLQKKYLVF